MKKVFGVFGLRFTTGHAIWAAALIPACIALFLPPDLLWVGKSRWPSSSRLPRW